MILDNASKLLLDILNNAGYNAYAVGGCVRDAIMGVEAKDVDITTSATPEQVEVALSNNNIKFIETGIKHGTVTAIINHIPYEITTFRKDGEYSDNRHPENVEFVTDIKEDLSRRDFTMNAIAYNNEGYIDYFDGIDDIKNIIIRCVGNPNKRFNEDALRIMRAIRFSSVLGFEIEEETKKAIFNNKELLKNITVERVFVELSKLLLGDNVQNVLNEYKEVIAVIIPELEPCFGFHQNTKYHLYDVYTHSIKAVEAAPKSIHLRLAALLHDIGKPNCCVVDNNGTDHFKCHPIEGAEMAKVILRRFKVSNDIYNSVVDLIKYHDDHITTNTTVIKRWLRLLGVNAYYDLIELKIADMKAHNLDYSQISIDALNCIKELTNGIIERNEPYLISHLKINGKDLIELGYNGKEIADELDNLIRIVSVDCSLNEREYLLKQSKRDLG